jgi:hypothetical protein
MTTFNRYKHFPQQNWGNHADVAQSIVGYGIISSYVCVICWLGNDLTEQVRIPYISNPH